MNRSESAPISQANNRQHSSTALRTTDMWSNVIGDAFGKANDVTQVSIAFPASSPTTPPSHRLQPFSRHFRRWCLFDDVHMAND